jgi:transcriptional regulator with XRE-family HTH domain
MSAVDTCISNDCNRDMAKGARSQLARKLRILRVMREWSQEDLASASGLHRTHISLIERSACSITLDKLEQLANTFDISLPELLDATEPTEGSKRLLATLAKSGRKKRSGRAC